MFVKFYTWYHLPKPENILENQAVWYGFQFQIVIGLPVKLVLNFFYQFLYLYL